MPRQRSALTGDSPLDLIQRPGKKENRFSSTSAVHPFSVQRPVRCEISPGPDTLLNRASVMYLMGL